MILHGGLVVVLDEHQDLASVTGASVKANPWVGSSDRAEAAVMVAVEEQAHPSSHILYLVAPEGWQSERCYMVGEVASIVVPSMVEELAVVLLASLLTWRALDVDSRACNRIYHHMNAVAPENAFSDCVNDAGGENSSGVCDILPPRDMPLLLPAAPCLSCSADVCG